MFFSQKRIRAQEEPTVVWLKNYINSPDAMALLNTNPSLELIAEATFWSVELGLDKHLARMSYSELRQFHPLEEICTANTDRGKLLKAVDATLKKADMWHEVSNALQQAGWCVFLHNNSFAQMNVAKEAYECEASSACPNRP
ncbi:MAG: hypothetical protein ACHP65_02305 [Legionellales bacterium]